MHSQSRVTTSLFGIARNETPYWEEWFEYHLELGFDRIHLISTDDDFPAIRKQLDKSRYHSLVDLYHFDDFQLGWQVGCYNRFLPKAVQDWTLVIDLDEFLYLPCSADITTFLEEIPDDIGQIQFPWANVFSDHFVHERTFDILTDSTAHASDHVKSMVRRRDTKGFGVHSHNANGAPSMLASGVRVPASHRHSMLLRDLSHFQDQPLIIHFGSRGHLDVLTRISDQMFFNEKNGEFERNQTRQFLEQNVGISHLPTRFFLAKLQQCKPQIDIDHLCLPRLDSETNVALIRECFGRVIQNTLEFEGNDDEPIEQTLDARYGLTEKLFDINIEQHFDLDEYLSCNSQIQAVRKLRQRATQRPG